jgi:hypothetical protein
VSAPLWATHYRVGDAAPRYFSAQAQPAREAPAAAHPGQTMHLGTILDGVFTVLEIRRVQGGRWRSVWRDDTPPWR